MKSRSIPGNLWNASAVPAIAAATLLFALSGCGVNVTPRPGDSSTGDSATPPGPAGMTPGMPVASATPGGAQQMTPVDAAAAGMQGMHGTNSGGGAPAEAMAPAGGPAAAGAGMHGAGGGGAPGGAPPAAASGAGHGGSGGDPALDPAAMSQQYGAGAGHGADASVGDPALDQAAMEQMRAQYEQQNGAAAGAGAGNPLTQMIRGLDGVLKGAPGSPDGGGPGAGVGDPALDPAAMERMRAQYEGAAGQGAAGGPAGAEAGYGGYGGAQGGRTGKFEEGTPGYVVMQLADAIAAGDLETAGKYISSRAKGQLGAVRDGKIEDNQLKQLQSYVETLDQIGNARPRGRSVTMAFNGGQDKVLSFSVAKQGGEFVVESMAVHDAPTRAGRR